MEEAGSNVFEMETVPSYVETLDEDTRCKLVGLLFTKASQTRKGMT